MGFLSLAQTGQSAWATLAPLANRRCSPAASARATPGFGLRTFGSTIPTP
jgi:hypothetical protein